MKAEDKHESSGSYRKQHVLFVLVDGSRIRNRVGVFDDRDRLSYRKQIETVGGDHQTVFQSKHSQEKNINGNFGCNQLLGSHGKWLLVRYNKYL